MEQARLASASFDKRVKYYWIVQGVLISAVTLFGIVFIPFVILIGLFVAQRILDSMSAELFERKLVVKRGIFFKVEKSIPLEKITDVGLTQGPLMRAFGLYRLDFETAGQSGHGALVSMIGIIDAVDFRDTILKQKDDLLSVPKSQPSAAELGDKDNTLNELLLSVKRIEKILSKKYHT